MAMSLILDAWGINMKRIFVSLALYLASISPAMAAMAIDGGISGTTLSGNNLSVTLTTTSTNDVIYLFSKSLSSNIGSITDTAGLTWVNRGLCSGTPSAEGWYAISSGALTSDVITAHYPIGPGSTRVTAFGVSGANTSSPFDGNGSIPSCLLQASGSSAAVTISTNNANDMLIASLGVTSTLGTLTRPSGFISSGIASGTVTDTSYDIVSSTQSSITETWSWTGGSQANNLFFDAIQAAPVIVVGNPSINIPYFFGGFP